MKKIWIFNMIIIKNHNFNQIRNNNKSNKYKINNLSMKMIKN